MEKKWEVEKGEARRIQENLRNHLVEKHLPSTIELIAGADVSFNQNEKDVYGAIVVMSYPMLEPVEYSCIKIEVNFPYIPGFLSFREIPALIKAWEKIKVRPQVILLDGHGIAHPRQMGIAAHFGLVVGLPTIGVAKKPLYGRYDEPSATAGDFSYLFDPKKDEVIGTVLRTKTNTAPLFISPGHLCTLSDAMQMVQNTTRGYRLPEPTRQAHNLVNQARTGELVEMHSFLYQATEVEDLI